MSDRKILLTELFYSIQGEGVYNGVPSIFVRLFGCNFECNGFSNTDLDGNIGDIEIKQVDSIAELSNEDFTKGCDSRYSWHKDYEHLSQKLTAHEIAEQIVDQLPGETFSLGQDNIHLVFTGGEPMMNQSAMVDIMKALVSLDVGFENEVTVTIETNGSLRMTRKLRDFFDYSLPDNHVLFSVSPKLSASGEPKALAFNLPAVKSYILENSQFSFKFVVGNQEHVDEVVDYCEEVLADPTIAEYPCPVYLMPVGATAEQQNEILPWVAGVCMQAGWFLSMRSHVYIFGNELGT